MPYNEHRHVSRFRSKQQAKAISYKEKKEEEHKKQGKQASERLVKRRVKKMNRYSLIAEQARKIRDDFFKNTKVNTTTIVERMAKELERKFNRIAEEEAVDNFYRTSSTYVAGKRRPGGGTWGTIPAPSYATALGSGASLSSVLSSMPSTRYSSKLGYTVSLPSGNRITHLPAHHENLVELYYDTTDDRLYVKSLATGHYYPFSYPHPTLNGRELEETVLRYEIDHEL